MTLNAGKTTTVTPRFPVLRLNDVVLVEHTNLEILDVKFEAKLTFESHLRMVAKAASQRIGITRRFWRLFDYQIPLRRSFF